LPRFRPSPPLQLSGATVPNEQLFAAAFENAPYAMALISADGGIVQCNRNLCRMLGFSRSELCALTAGDIVHPDDVETEREQRNRLAAADIGRYDLVQRFVRKDLQTLWARVSVSAVRGSSPEAAFFVAHLEPVPPHNCSDAEANGAWYAHLGEATLAAIHEIGNSLTPLMLNTEMLVEQSNSEEISQSAHGIFKAARRIAFALRRLRRVQDPQKVAYVGENRMLDLRIVAPPADRNADSSEAGAA
jgi:PAS domain S-box-containing protein